MLKTLLCCLTVLFSTLTIAQNDFEKEIDSISTELDATSFLEHNKSTKGKFITFNREKHNTKLADDLFKLSTGGKKVYKTEMYKTYYKVIEKVETPHYRISCIYFNGKEKSLEEITQLRKDIIAKFNTGFPFKNLAKRYSMDRNANRGGDLGWLAKGEMYTEFEDQIINSNYTVGDIFTVDVTSQQWYYVVLKTHDTKMIEEIKVLKVTEPIK
jgi:parvulin-like peptidyl-prolyl isomerase